MKRDGVYIMSVANNYSALCINAHNYTHFVPRSQ